MKTRRLEPVENVNLSQQAYCRLRLALLDGHFRPGERLRLRDLAKELGTSVTPVREAVLQLVNDGALRLRTQRDIRVRALSAEEYLEVAAIRKAAEGLAVERFVEVMRPGHLQELERLERQHLEALERRQYRAAVAADRRFMLTIFQALGMKIFLETLDRVWLIARPTISLLYSDEGVSRVELGHGALLDALREGDAARAREVRLRQIDAVATVLVEMLRDKPEESIAAGA